MGEIELWNKFEAMDGREEKKKKDVASDLVTDLMLDPTMNLDVDSEQGKSKENEMKIDEEKEKGQGDEKVAKREEFLSSWDAIPEQKELHHLDKLLERENLCGVWAKLDENLEEKHSFWNASDNVKCGGYNDSIFENAHSKKYVKL